MKKELPIIFSTLMVEALIAGRKTMTRRIVKGSWLKGLESGFVYDPDIRSPYGMKGDILYVRETFTEYPSDILDEDDNPFVFKAGHIRPDEVDVWKPCIHMPKAAARIWLEVTDVRVEHAQDISMADAIAEGISFYKDDYGRLRYRDYFTGGTVGMPIASFASLWESINGRESWVANPSVWVVSFEVLSTTGKPAILIPDVD